MMLTAISSAALAVRGDTVASILTRSPFLPPGFQPPGGSQAMANVPVSTSQFEFHGVYQLGGVYHFNLFNKRDQKGAWVTENSNVADFPTIVSYDVAEDRVQVELSGETVSLVLIKATDKPMPITGAAAPNVPGIKPRPSSTGTAIRPTPARRRVIRPSSRTSSTTTRRPTAQNPSQN